MLHYLYLLPDITRIKEGTSVAESCRVHVTWGTGTGLSEILYHNERSSPPLRAYMHTKLTKLTWNSVISTDFCFCFPWLLQEIAAGNAFESYIATVLFLCYCKYYFMALLIWILLNILKFHGCLFILMLTYLNSLCFSLILQTYRFYFHYYRCWGTDFLWSNSWSDSTWKCTVNFPLVSVEIKI